MHKTNPFLLMMMNEIAELLLRARQLPPFTNTR
jgi:hypothetical protein